MKILVVMGGKSINVELNDSAVAESLIEQLPLTLDLKDYEETEKIAFLPKKLTTTGAPKKYQGKRGDLAYYAPWGNLAFFYRDSIMAPGLIPLGIVISGITFVESAKSGKITISVKAGR